MSESEVTAKRAATKLQEPSPYAVVLHNDPFTPRAFVVLTLKECFRKTEVESQRLMMRAHADGAAVIGLFTRDIAESKAAKANDFSAKHGRVLLFTAEKS